MFYVFLFWRSCVHCVYLAAPISAAFFLIFALVAYQEKKKDMFSSFLLCTNYIPIDQRLTCLHEQISCEDFVPYESTNANAFIRWGQVPQPLISLSKNDLEVPTCKVLRKDLTEKQPFVEIFHPNLSSLSP